jgi:hypothetical protein
MGQGEAKITFQSNVRIALKGERSTRSERVNALGAAVGAKTAELKACYAKVVESDPTAVGAIEVALALTEDDAKPKVEVRQSAGFTSDMLTCVRRVLQETKLDKNQRPAAAMITLEFSNSRAQGEEAMAARSASTLTDAVVTNAQGKLEVSWSAPGDKVAFTALAEPSETKESPAAALRALKKTLGAFLDCRRKAAKGGASPAGASTAALTWSRGALATAQLESSTLSKPPAVTCIKNALGRLKIENGPQSGRVTVTVTFKE